MVAVSIRGDAVVEKITLVVVAAQPDLLDLHGAQLVLVGPDRTELGELLLVFPFLRCQAANIVRVRHLLLQKRFLHTFASLLFFWKRAAPEANTSSGAAQQTHQGLSRRTRL